MQEVKFKIGDLVEFCTETQELLRNDLIWTGYGMITDVYLSEHIGEMIYVVEIYKGTERSINAEADITGFKFMLYESQIHHDMRLLNAGTKD